jgi:hypothetical protein
MTKDSQGRNWAGAPPPEDVLKNLPTTEEIKRINTYRGATPETAALLVEQGYWTEQEAAVAVEHRRSIDADEDWRFNRRLVEFKRLHPGGGRPKSPTNRDALINCLRACFEAEYYQIDRLLAEQGLKVPASKAARFTAKQAGRKSLNGKPCAHADLHKLRL